MKTPQLAMPVALVLCVALLATGCTSHSKAKAGATSTAGPTSTPTATASGPPGPAPTAGKMSPGVPAKSDSAAAKSGNQTSVLLSMPGTTATTPCLAVGTHTVVHAGSVAVGDFAFARTTYAKAPVSPQAPIVRLYVIPQHTKKHTGVTVTMTPAAGGKGSTARSKSVQLADLWQYYSVNLPVPKPGTYRVSATAGADHGCFLVDFSR